MANRNPLFHATAAVALLAASSAVAFACRGTEPPSLPPNSPIPDVSKTQDDPPTAPPDPPPSLAKDGGG